MENANCLKSYEFQRAIGASPSFVGAMLSLACMERGERKGEGGGNKREERRGGGRGERGAHCFKKL
jgi:hypothetical protein